MSDMNILWDGPNPAPTCATTDLKPHRVDPRDLKMWQGQQRINMLERENQELRNILYRDRRGEVCENCRYYSRTGEDETCTHCLEELCVDLENGTASPEYTDHCSGFKVRK